MADAWYESQVHVLKKEFDRMDTDGYGCLPVPKVVHVLEAVGFRGSEEDALTVLGDKDEDVLSRDDFIDIIRTIPTIIMQQMALRRDFWTLDQNSNGRLSREEIMDATKSSCLVDVSAEGIADLLITCAKASKRELDYEEYLATLDAKMTTRTLERLFLQLDADGSGYLTKDEILAAMRDHKELHMKLGRLVELLIACYKDTGEKIYYMDFIKAYTYRK